MSAAQQQLAEARVTGLVLRATARVMRGEQCGLAFRLNRAANALDGVVLLAMRCLERIKQLEAELHQPRAGG